MTGYSELRLSTSRLELRPLCRGDALPLYGIYADPEFMRYWSTPAWTGIDQAAALIEGDLRELAEGQHIRLGIFRRASAALIGTCSLFNFSAQCRRAEIGYGIARAQWRQGYMTEAVTALIDYAFLTLDLNRLEADIDPRNTASASSLERLGFVKEGLLRERWTVAGEVSDSALYGLLARDWRRARTGAGLYPPADGS
jgi:RimJ/RimL family protein N-acetyltransferase